mmetsp:Transcript_1691/g.3338  ORF Transcript_1691/g.3338 Transcript_1691/m.3338 type:complete len:196 (-) Transcript_1691:98-685(-)
MLRKALGVVFLAGCGHAGATVASLESPDALAGPGTIPADASAIKAGAAAVDPSHSNAHRAARLVTELYRGQKRYARLPTAYTEDCELETPAVAVTGRQQVIVFYQQGISLVKPVQLSARVLTTSEDHVDLAIISEYSIPVLGSTRLIPAMISLDLDEEGRITKHREEWYGRGLVEALGITRKINGAIMGAFSSSA